MSARPDLNFLTGAMERARKENDKEAILGLGLKLCTAYSDADQRDEAEALLAELLSVAESIKGMTSPELVEVLEAQVQLFLDAGRLVPAQETLERLAKITLDDSRILHRAAHMHTTLGEVCVNLRMWDKAEEALRRAAELGEAHGEADEIVNATCLLAKVLEARGLKEQIPACLHKAEAAARTAEYPTPVDRASDLRRVGAAYRAIENWEDAASNLAAAVENVNLVVNDQTERPTRTAAALMASTSAEHAEVLVTLRRLRDAEEVVRAALPVAMRRLGADDPATADVRAVLGSVLRQQGRMKDAEAELDKAQQALEKARNRSEVLERQYMVSMERAMVLWQLERTEDARAAFESAKNLYELLGVKAGTQLDRAFREMEAMFTRAPAAVAAEILRRCGRPDCGACEMRALEFLRCSRCKDVYYCTAQCQKQDWPQHKTLCTPPAKK